MKTRNAFAAVAAAAVIIASATGCGATWSEDHDYNAPTPSVNITPDWVRVDTPYGYDTLLRSCENGDGLYVSRDNAPNVIVVGGDPACNQ